MWFKNLQLYRLPRNWAADAAEIEEQLATLTLQGCGASDPRSIGWVAPRDGGSLIHAVNQQWLLALGVVSMGVFLAGYFVFDRLRDSFAEEV